MAGGGRVPEILSNAAIVTSDDRISRSTPRAASLVARIVDVDLVENLGGGLVTPADRRAHPSGLRATQVRRDGLINFQRADSHTHARGRRHLVHGDRDQGHRPLDAVRQRA